jgi:hypothetical protein
LESKRAELQKPVLAECQSRLQENTMDNDNLNLEIQQEEVNLMNETSPNMVINYHQIENKIPNCSSSPTK